MKILSPILALISLGVMGALAAASHAKTTLKQETRIGLPRVMEEPCPTATPAPPVE